MRAAAAALLVAAAGCGAAPGRTAGDMVLVPAGTFRMGCDDGQPCERPVHDVTLRAFRLDRHAVTVDEFAAFVAATGYRTTSERLGWSGVFDAARGGWTKTDGADWRRPDGPARPAPAPREPVTQVSWDDAAAYCRWAGKRLPTEAEYEYAARGGLAGRRYAWGDETTPGGRFLANWWQGAFPGRDDGADGFAGRAPVGSFPPNGYGLLDMTGNVWEWCADRFGDYAADAAADPAGPASGDERVIRGGSWLCTDATCLGYRVAARNHSPPDTALNNLGFRCEAGR